MESDGHSQFKKWVFTGVIKQRLLRNTFISSDRSLRRTSVCERDRERNSEKEMQAVPVLLRRVCLEAVANRHEIPHAHTGQDI